MEAWPQVVNRYGSGRQCSWPILRYNPGIPLERLNWTTALLWMMNLRSKLGTSWTEVSLACTVQCLGWNSMYWHGPNRRICTCMTFILKHLSVYRRTHSERGSVKCSHVMVKATSHSRTSWTSCLCLVSKPQGTSKFFMPSRYMVRSVFFFVIFIPCKILSVLYCF